MNAPLFIGASTGAPGLQRFQVDEQKAAARAAVARLHAISERCAGGSLGPHIQEAAVLLDEYQAGGYVATPCANSGWVLVPATLAPKIRAAVEALLRAMESSDTEAYMAGDYCSPAQWDAAMAGGQAVLAVLDALEAQP